jgi:thiamine-phosphate pyrophosphorylase
MTGEERRERLRAARLYFVVEAQLEHANAAEVVAAALAGGVDMVQLRDKGADDETLLRTAASFRSLCDEHNALFWVNDRPELALAASADGVHVGQDDLPVAEVRRRVGPGRLVGLSTHAPEQLDAALSSDADEFSVGPVFATPTKEGRPPSGLGYVRYAAERAGDAPWFAIGGIDEGNVGEVAAAGAGRIVVVRAIRDAPDPAAAARALREALDRGAVGAAR